MAVLHSFFFFFPLIFGRAGSWLRYTDFSLPWLLLLQSAGSKVCGLPELQLKGSRAQAQ